MREVRSCSAAVPEQSIILEMTRDGVKMSCLGWLYFFLLSQSHVIVAAADSSTLYEEQQEYEARLFPRRTVQEAAVLEWGNSAIITALDASVALFGPQTSDAALLEVETAPVLGVPLDGLRIEDKRVYREYLKTVGDMEEKARQNLEQAQRNLKDEDSEEQQEDEVSGVPEFEVPVKPLDNADEIVGNLCIMTTHPGVSGVEMALMAQESGAAALLVVNVDDPHRPDDIYRLPPSRSKLVYKDHLANLGSDNAEDDDMDFWQLHEEPDPRADQVDIPVVMISLNSAQLLATALLDPELPNAAELARRAGFTAQYMPERVRLYAGDDRPFFEDVEAAHPTIYLIHDLLKASECSALIEQAETAGWTHLSAASSPDRLQYTPAPSNFVNVDRVTLWQGLWMTQAAKQVEERLEQVTSFPSAHFSDFIIDRLATDGSSYIHAQYDIFGDSTQQQQIPVASMTIFLSDLTGDEGGDILYPSVLGADYDSSKQPKDATASTPIQIQPRKGMAVIHHSTDEHGRLEKTALHALLPVMQTNPSNDVEYFYVARKYIFMEPMSKAQRIVLPALALPGRGRLPDWVVQAYDWFCDQFGYEQGTMIFEKACVFVPVLIVLLLVQFIVDRVRAHWNQVSATTTSTKGSASTKGSTTSSDTKSGKKKETTALASKSGRKKKTAKQE